MGSNGASTGSGGTGGGTVGPAGVKVDKKGNKKYGTALDAKLTSNRFENNNDNNNGGGGDNNGNQVVQAPKVTSPTTAEVSQVTPEITSEEARASANELIKKKRRGRGRSLNMLQTSAQGLSNEGLTLSNKTLLG